MISGQPFLVNQPFLKLPFARISRTVDLRGDCIWGLAAEEGGQERGRRSRGHAPASSRNLQPS